MRQLAAGNRFKVFVVIWVGIVFTALGTQLTGFALGVWAYQRTDSATQFALISVFALLPGIVISPVAGTLVDRWDRRWVLIMSDAVAALGTLSILILLLLGRLEIWYIYLITAVESICTAFFQPAFAASITLLVPKQHYGRANGMLQLGFAGAQIIAPMLAGVLVLAVGVQSVLLFDLATFLIAITILGVVRIPNPPRIAEGQAGQGVLKREIAYGWKYITTRPGLLGLLIFFAITNFALGIVEVLLTPLVLGFANADVLGQVLSAAGVGTLLGGLVMSIWGGPKRRVSAILGFTLLQGAILFLGGVQPNAFLVATAAAVYLFSAQIIYGCSQALWQSKVDPAVQGRIFALRSMVASSSLPLAYFVAGPLADYIFKPLLVSDGALAGSVGRIIGVGPGRGIGLLYIVLGGFILLVVIGGYLYPRLRLVELELPDAVVESAPFKSLPDNLLQEDQAILPAD